MFRNMGEIHPVFLGFFENNDGRIAKLRAKPPPATCHRNVVYAAHVYMGRCLYPVDFRVEIVTL